MTANRLFDLSGRVAIITGGAGLLGREYALALADMGAHIVIADIDVTAGAQVLAEISEQSGGGATLVRTDVSCRSSVQAMVMRILEERGQIDILINNAALDPKFDRAHGRVEHLTSFENFPLEAWERSLAVDLTGMFLCAQAVATPMLKRGRGVIVNVSSIYGVVGPDQRIYQISGAKEQAYKPVTYSVTKSAVLGLTRYLATYWAGKNIRVNALTLGGVYNDHDDEFTRLYSNRTPLGRMATRDEYCGALLFLVSDASSYMTGANLVVDGGLTAW
jgi:NAD(P)-dependent dehydrogenase (short-subunit alcohol dehydrogenase family)